MPQTETSTQVALFSKPHPDAPEVLARLARRLDERGFEVLADETTAESLGLSRSVSRERAAAQARLVVSVGGDGTLLASARAVGEALTPILGINLGSLGFLTETRCEEAEAVLDAALDGRAPIDSRRALQVVKDDLPAESVPLALNDVVLSKKHLARLFSLSLFVDDEWVADYRADGLIIATPTGSTAYNLAAGGPLLLPGVEALIVNPICPHSLSQRPLILPGSAKISICLADRQDNGSVQVTLDGQVGFPIEAGEKVSIVGASRPIRLLRPPGRSFFSVLRGKLGWGHP
ncbi:MAG: NAD(+)/NADH kinase [Acidobacteriota bacterium]|nr:NAD(+)/NADH kinase [Acidobacteriota bacterium]